MSAVDDLFTFSSLIGMNISNNDSYEYHPAMDGDIRTSFLLGR